MINKEVVFFATTACWYEAAQRETDAAAPMQQWTNNPRKTKQNKKTSRWIDSSWCLSFSTNNTNKKKEKKKRIIRQKCERIVVYGQRVEISWTVGSPYVARKEKKREIKYLRGVAGFTSLYWLTCQVQRKHGTIYDSVHQVYTKDFH